MEWGMAYFSLSKAQKKYKWTSQKSKACFFDSHGIILKEFVLENHIVNQHFYGKVLAKFLKMVICLRTNQTLRTTGCYMTTMIFCHTIISTRPVKTSFFLAGFNQEKYRKNILFFVSKTAHSIKKEPEIFLFIVSCWYKKKDQNWGKDICRLDVPGSMTALMHRTFKISAKINFIF